MNGLLKYIMPEAASSFATDVDQLIFFIFLLSAFFFFLIVFVGLAFVVKFKRKKGDKYTLALSDNKTLEMVWTIIPTILLLVIFVWGVKAYLDQQVIPQRAMEVKVTGQKWFWTFAYDDGLVSTGEMVVPVNQPVKILLSSKDVLHSFFVPAFRVKQDALPNRYTALWFTPTKVGEFPLYCTEYCGTEHSSMVANVKVVDQADYIAWKQEQANAMGAGMSPVELGKQIYQKNACFTCHSLDGSNKIGPSWLGAYGTKRKLADGSEVVIDENYIRESILNPMAKIAQGYQPVMPTYQGILNETQIDGVIAYIKELNQE